MQVAAAKNHHSSEMGLWGFGGFFSFRVLCASMDFKISGGKPAIQFRKYVVLGKKRKEMDFNAVGIPLLLSLQLNAEP